MKALGRMAVICVSAWLVLAGACHGKQLFFRNGETMDCQSAWRQGDSVIVKVNRDTVLHFSTIEVDLRRTFPHKVRVRVAAPVTAPGSVAGENASPPAAAKAAASPSGTSATPAAAASPSGAQTPPAKPVEKATAPATASVPPAPATASAPAQSAKVAAPEKAAPAPASTSPDKAELERQTRDNAQAMTKGIEQKDPEMVKKALLAQQKVVADQKKAALPLGGKPSTDAPAIPEVGVTYLVLVLVLLLLMVVSLWVVFVKAGQAGWKSLVPLYNMYLLLKISGKPGWWLLLLFVPLAGLAFQILAMISLAGRFGRSAVFGIGLSFLPMIFFPLLAFGRTPSEA